MTAAEVAARLAAALDAEDYAAARGWLADDCVYHIDGGDIVGPDAIIDSYRGNGDQARRRFDEIRYASEAVGTAPDAAEVTYTDRLRRGAAWHEFRCRQRLRVAAGAVVEITHEELPGERDRLREFEGR